MGSGWLIITHVTDLLAIYGFVRVIHDLWRIFGWWAGFRDKHPFTGKRRS